MNTGIPETRASADPANDLEALANGVAALTPIGPDLTQETGLERFTFLERL